LDAVNAVARGLARRGVETSRFAWVGQIGHIVYCILGVDLADVV
jgi:hypothetical protein